MYGFPKEIPPNITDFKQWIIDEGYPKEDVEMLKYGRGWYKTVYMTVEELQAAIGEFPPIFEKMDITMEALLEMDMNIKDFIKILNDKLT